MGVTHDGTFFPESTGAVDGPPEAVEYGQPVDGESTGELDGPPASVTTKFGPSGLKSTNAVELPESQTFTNPGVKVVNGPERRGARGASTAETEPSTNTGSTRTQKAANHDGTGAGGN